MRWEKGRRLIRVGCENKSTAKSVNSVLQPLSLGFAEPASFAQGSRNKIIYCDKNLLAKLVVTGFCAAYAAQCVESPHPTSVLQ